ncbi:hypothetical protein A6A27_21790 [Micromonospora sp. CB01531]|nr:hypothetical protein A6A27_21790 [Micromonospora sp. CB01531]
MPLSETITSSVAPSSPWSARAPLMAMTLRSPTCRLHNGDRRTLLVVVVSVGLVLRVAAVDVAGLVGQLPDVGRGAVGEQEVVDIGGAVVVPPDRGV